MAVDPQQLSALVAETTGTPKGARDHLVPIQRTVTRGDKVFEQRFWVNPNKGDRVAPELKAPAIPLTAIGYTAGGAPNIGEHTRQEHDKLVGLGRELVHGINRTGFPAGVHSIASGEEVDQELGGEQHVKGANGAYDSSKGRVIIDSATMESVRAAAAAGGARNTEHLAAFAVLSHEFMHGATDASAKEYEGSDQPNRPHAAMQEASTEVLGRYFSMDVAASISGSVDPSLAEYDPKSDSGAMFHWRPIGAGTADSDVYCRTFCAYPGYVQAFGRLAVYAAGAEGIDRKEMTRVVVGTAAAVKPLPAEKRYDWFARKILERHQIEPHQWDDYDPARAKLVSYFKTFVQEPIRYQRLTSELDGKVREVVLETLARRQVRQEEYRRYRAQRATEGETYDD